MTSVDFGLHASPSETISVLPSTMNRLEQRFLVGLSARPKTLLRPALPVFRFVCSISASQRTFSLKPMGSMHVFEHNIIMSSVEHISTIALAAATIGFMTAIVTGLSIIQVPWTLSCRARQISHNSSDYVLNASWVCKTIQRAAMLTAQDTCSTNFHVDYEPGMLC